MINTVANMLWMEDIILRLWDLPHVMCSNSGKVVLVYSLKLKDTSDDILYILSTTNPRKRPKYVCNKCVFEGWYIPFLCAIELHCCPKMIQKTHQWAALLHWMTCCFTTMKIYFHSITQTVNRPATHLRTKCGLIRKKSATMFEQHLIKRCPPASSYFKDLVVWWKQMGRVPQTVE